MDKKLLTVDEAAEYLCINANAVRALIRKKEIPAIKYSERRTFIDSQDLHEWINSKKTIAS